MAPLDFPDIIGLNGSNSENKRTHFGGLWLLFYRFTATPFPVIVYGEKMFWTSMHHVMKTKVVITWFGHYMCSWDLGRNLATTLPTMQLYNDSTWGNLSDFNKLPLELQKEFTFKAALSNIWPLGGRKDLKQTQKQVGNNRCPLSLAVAR